MNPSSVSPAIPAQQPGETFYAGYMMLSSLCCQVTRLPASPRV